MGYRRGYGHRNVPRGARWMELHRLGVCARCGDQLPKGTRAFWDPGDRTVCCTKIECADAHGLTKDVWHGSPISGGYVKVLSEHRIGGLSAPPDPFAKTRSRGYYGRDAGRCEDAPCCGCCS